MQLQKNVPLAQFTRFGVGGVAENYFAPTSVAELSEFFNNSPPGGSRQAVGAPVGGKNFHILGAGSNVLIPDAGLSGIVIHTIKLTGVRPDGDEIVAECGTPDAIVSRYGDGLKFLAGIPGTIGAAVLTNAGCWGREVSDAIVSVDVMDLTTGAVRTVAAADLNLSYRHGEIPHGTMIVSVRLRRDGPQMDIDELLAKKNASQPVAAKTAGSTFKNPAAGPAWKFIKESGAAELTVGGARVSPVHANFVENYDNATAADIRELIARIQERVAAHSGVHLEPEVTIL
ncbi:MAG: FAD-binding protein [Rickettsiales bacterium]|nr:FAD-binding protein [Rickettsiales bacterium]